MMHSMPVKNPISYTFSNGYNEPEEIYLPNDMCNNDAPFTKEKTEMALGVCNVRVVGLFLTPTNNIYDSKYTPKGIKLGAIIFSTKNNFTAADLRKIIVEQLTDKVPSSFDLLTSSGWPLLLHQEPKVPASHLISTNSSVCIQRHFEKIPVGVANNQGDNIGFIFADLEFSLQKTRQVIQDQLKDVLPTKREFRFLESHGWPVKPAQENQLQLCDLLSATATHISLQFGERAAAPPPLPPIGRTASNNPEPRVVMDVVDRAPGERHKIMNMIREFSVKRPKPDDSGREMVAKAILISYVRNEAAQHALSLKEELCNMNCSVYLDVDEIKPSIDWQDCLNYAVSNCTIFVPLLTPLYGKTLWTNREVKLADVRQKVITPVNFTDQWPPDCLAIQFASTQYIPWKLPPPEGADASKQLQQDWKMWDRENIHRTAKDIADRLMAIKSEKIPRKSMSKKDSGSTNRAYHMTEMESPRSTKSLIVISIHPKQRGIALELSRGLQSEGYTIWCSCEPHTFTDGEEPVSPRDLPPIPEGETCLSQDLSASLKDAVKEFHQHPESSGEFNDGCCPGASCIKGAQQQRQLTRTISNLSDNHYMSTISQEKLAQLKSFQQNVNQAGVVVVLTSEDYFRSKFSHQQVFYCEHRKKVIVVETDGASMPTWFSMLMGQEPSLVYSSTHFLPSLRSRIKKALNPGVTESPTDTVTEAKLQCWVNFMKTNGLSQDLCIYIVGTASCNINPRTKAICKALGEEVAKIENVTLVTGGFFGVPELVGRTFSESRDTNLPSTIFHVLPHRDSQDYTSKAPQNPDGSFEQLSYGKSIFVGDSVKERDMAIARHIDTCILIEGGPAAAHEVEEFIWNDHFVIPVYSTGGAAGGNYGVPVKIFEMPPPVNKEDWELLSEKGASPETVAKAIVNILVVIKQSIAAHTNKTQELKAAVGVRNKSRRRQRIIGERQRIIGELATNRESRILPTTPSYDTSAIPAAMDSPNRNPPVGGWLRRVFGHRKS